MRLGSSLALTQSRRGGAGGWTPAALAGLVAWYTASPLYCFSDAGVTPCGDGDPIHTWLDRSGNGRTLTQTTLSFRPIYYDLGGGRGVATYDGVDDFFDTTFPPVTQTSFWTAAVAVYDVTSGFLYEARNSENGNPIDALYYGGGIVARGRGDAGGLVDTAAAPAPAGFACLENLWDGVNISHVAGGVVQASAAFAPAGVTVDGFGVGCSGRPVAAAANFGVVSVSEFLKFSAAPQPADRARVREFLSA